VICQYCGGENVSTEAPIGISADPLKIAELTRVLGNVAQVYWQNYRGIGKSSEAIEFTDALGKALGEYKGDGA
jgi:hypothetical protein